MHDAVIQISAPFSLQTKIAIGFPRPAANVHMERVVLFAGVAFGAVFRAFAESPVMAFRQPVVHLREVKILLTEPILIPVGQG